MGWAWVFSRAERAKIFETMLFISLENAPSVKNLPFYCEKESEMPFSLFVSWYKLPLIVNQIRK